MTKEKHINADGGKAAILEFVARIRAHADLNAFISVCTDEQVQTYLENFDPTLPLAGYVFSVKDNILSADYPTTAGSGLLKDFHPNIDAKIIQQFKQAGAFLIGKNNLSEFCQSMTCNNASFGAVKNPANPKWIAGGSSGGSAAAVAAGLVSFAIGSDTGGSVPIPAALCGCVGYRPTTGRYSTDGFIPVSPSIDSPGLMTQSVADLFILDHILTQTDAKNSVAIENLRLGIPQTPFYKGLDAQLEKCVHTQLDFIKQCGATLIDIDLTESATLNPHVGFPIAFYEMLREMAVFFARHGVNISVLDVINNVSGPTEKDALQAQLDIAAIPREQYVKAIQEKWPALIKSLDNVYNEHKIDALIVPTTPLAAINHRQLGKDNMFDDKNFTDPVFVTYIRNTEMFSNYGAPYVTLPIGKTPEGRPVGLGFVGKPQNDAHLLSLCLALEQAFEKQK